MTHGSLFSGIGGFDLAAEWMGWENKFHCEWNEFGQKVLKHYWPNAKSYYDITKSDFTIWRGKIDILTGGFPCQPYSLAGKRNGKEDDRHLWPEMLRAVREIQPRWVVGENVYGLINWSGGLVFHEVQTDLEAEGYEVQPYVLPAVSVNAPHRRDRVWFVAHSNGSSVRTNEFRGLRQDNGQADTKGAQAFYDAIRSNGFKRTTPHSESEQGERLQPEQSKLSQPEQGEFGRGSSEMGNRDAADTRFFRTTWQEFPTQSPVCNGDDGFSTRLHGITFPKWRNESIKAGGNAIVPQIALQIFKAIQEYENTNKL